MNHENAQNTPQYDQKPETPEAFKDNPQGEMEHLAEQHAAVFKQTQAGNYQPELLKFMGNMEDRMNHLKTQFGVDVDESEVKPDEN